MYTSHDWRWESRFWWKIRTHCTQLFSLLSLCQRTHFRNNHAGFSFGILCSRNTFINLTSVFRLREGSFFIEKEPSLHLEAGESFPTRHRTKDDSVSCENKYRVSRQRRRLCDSATHTTPLSENVCVAFCGRSLLERSKRFADLKKGTHFYHQPFCTRWEEHTFSRRKSVVFSKQQLQKMQKHWKHFTCKKKI